MISISVQNFWFDENHENSFDSYLRAYDKGAKIYAVANISQKFEITAEVKLIILVYFYLVGKKSNEILLRRRPRFIICG